MIASLYFIKVNIPVRSTYNFTLCQFVALNLNQFIVKMSLIAYNSTWYTVLKTVVLYYNSEAQLAYDVHSVIPLLQVSHT